MLLNQTHLIFGDIANRWARESAGHPGALKRDEILERIIVGLRNDEFDQAELTIWRAKKYVLEGDENYVPQPEGWRSITRDMLNYFLVRDVPGNYNKQILEELRISKKGFRQWCDDQGLEPPTFWFHDTKPKEQRQTTVRAERKCEAWLVGLMDKKKPPQKTKTEYRANAKHTFGVGTRAFDRAWANAITTTNNTEWGRPGRKSIQNPN